ncbi:hypothetical protein [Candidatus Nanohalococcus occultus]|uniref:hypothetical protein n=1 Tax=Candidatus Nanohalococcus occultus TaxID=2978047 RepID=UPI0039E18306
MRKSLIGGLVIVLAVALVPVVGAQNASGEDMMNTSMMNRDMMVEHQRQHRQQQMEIDVLSYRIAQLEVMVQEMREDRVATRSQDSPEIREQ